MMPSVLALIALAAFAWCAQAAPPSPAPPASSSSPAPPVVLKESAGNPNCKPGNGTVTPGKISYYTSKYDNMNVDMILFNERLLKNYMDCLLDLKPCSREGQLLKEIIPDALQTECSRCTEKQKQIAGHIMSFLLQHKKKYWDELLKKYDPKGTFRQKYEVDEDEDD